MNNKSLRNWLKVVPLVLLCWMSVLSAPAKAVLTIDITKGVDSAIPIAIVPFKVQGQAGNALQPASIITNDLTNSGRFNAVDPNDFLAEPADLQSVQFKDWRLLKAEALVIGQIINRGSDTYEVQFRLIDVYREKQLVGQRFVVKSSLLRRVSHQISDIIFKELIGKPGAFDTRIAYVTVQGQIPRQKFLLQVADSDGFNPKNLLTSRQPILSPSWSKDGNKLAYVSFEKRRSNIFVHDIWTGKRQQIAEFKGINSAPSWSPDGTRLALTLSKDGNSEIYVMDLASRKVRRITNHRSIDTEPEWSPDGRQILFTSGRSGSPQLYTVSANGGTPKRLTFKGKYNAGGVYSPDGKSIALVTDQGKGFQIGLYSLQDQTLRTLTNTREDESPSFAPNGEMIIYATQRRGRKVLAAVSVDGNVEQQLKLQDGSVREPAWSPFNQKL